MEQSTSLAFHLVVKWLLWSCRQRGWNLRKNFIPRKFPWKFRKCLKHLQRFNQPNPKLTRSTPHDCLAVVKWEFDRSTQRLSFQTTPRKLSYRRTRYINGNHGRKVLLLPIIGPYFLQEIFKEILSRTVSDMKKQFIAFPCIRFDSPRLGGRGQNRIHLKIK